MLWEFDDAAQMISDFTAKLDQYLAGGGGSGGGGLFSYAYHATSTGGSLAHIATPEVGRAYMVAAFGVNSRGAGLWRCFALQSGSPTIGSLSYVSGTGIVMEGAAGRFVLVAPQAIDPAQIGGTLDARFSGQQALWSLAIEHCKATRAVLRVTGDIITAAGLDLSGARLIDGRSVEFAEAAAGYAGALVTLDMSDFKTSDPRESFLCAKGINVGPNTVLGQYDWQGTHSQATGFVLSSDNGGMSPRRFLVERLAVGVELKGNTEKNVYHVHAVYCSVAVRGTTTDGSPDTLQIHLSGTNNKQAFLPDDGDTSYQLFLNTEGRIDDGSTVPCNWNPAIMRPTAYIEAKNGKHFKLSGRHRGHNGRLMITDDRFYERGADTVEFLDFGVVHVYGIVYSSYRVQHLKGRLSLHDCLNGRPTTGASDSTGGSIPCPTVHLRQVDDASGFRIEAESIASRECVRWGDVATGLYSVGAHMGHYLGNMIGDLGFNPRTGIYPHDKTFLHIEKAVRCFAIFEAWGNIVAEIDSVENRIRVPHGAAWVLGGMSATGPANANLPSGHLYLDLEGDIALDDLFWRPWIFDGVSASVPELGGKVTRSNGSWSMATPPTVTLAQLQSSSHWLNTQVKREGAQVFCNGQPLFASGGAPTDPWKTAAGVTVATPSEQTATTAFAARVAAAGGVTLGGYVREAYDRFFFDLAESGVLPQLILLYFLGAQDEATAKLNLISGLSAGPYDLTAVNSPSFTSFRGYTGDGVSAHLQTGYNPQANAEGMAANNLHIGIYSLAAGDDSGFDAGSRGNGRLRIGGTDTGLIYSTSASNFIGDWQSGVGAPPHHLVASRRASPVGGRAYRNGAILGSSDGIAPSGTLPQDIDILRQGSDYSEETIAAFHVGKDLTDAQVAALYRALRKLAMRLGVVK